MSINLDRNTHANNDLQRKELDFLCTRIRERRFTEYFYVRLIRAIRHNPALALYLPFVVLRQSPNFFRAEYRQVWRNCLTNETPNSFVCREILIHRASQLVPWLLNAKIFLKKDIEEILASLPENSIESIELADGLRTARKNPGRGKNDYHPYSAFYNDHARLVATEMILYNM